MIETQNAERRTRNELAAPTMRAADAIAPRCEAVAGLTIGHIELAYVGKKLAGRISRSPSVSPFPFEKRSWVCTGFVHDGLGGAVARCLPVYLVGEFLRRFGCQPRKKPNWPKREATGPEAAAQRADAYFGVMVSVRGSLYAIGPVSEERTLATG